jgi:hypothetical protein
MTEEQLNGNKLIAKFLGKSEKIESAYMLGGGGYASCRFHESWDWLMGAVRKINGMGKEYQFAIFKTYVSCTVEKGGKFYKDFSFSHAEYITAEQTDIEAAFKLVVAFVEWHNEKEITS